MGMFGPSPLPPTTDKAISHHPPQRLSGLNPTESHRLCKEERCFCCASASFALWSWRNPIVTASAGG